MAEVSADEYRAQHAEQHAEAIADKMLAKIDDCDPDMTEKEATECRWSNTVKLLVFEKLADGLMANNGYWQYRAQRRQFWLSVAQLVLNNPFTNAFANSLFYDLGGGSDTVLKADRGGSIEYSGTSGPKSPFVKGDDNLAGVGSAQATEDATAANREGHIVRDSQGVSQAQAQTDSFPGTNFDEGGDFRPNSQFDPGLSLP